jgi:hypothetical protein
MGQAREQERHVPRAEPDLARDLGRPRPGVIQSGDTLNPSVGVVAGALAAQAAGSLVAKRVAAALARHAARELRVAGALAHPLRLGRVQPPDDGRGGDLELVGDLSQQRTVRTAGAGVSYRIVGRRHEK